MVVSPNLVLICIFTVILKTPTNTHPNNEQSAVLLTSHCYTNMLMLVFLYNICRIHLFQATLATQVLVESFVILRLGYHISLLACLPLRTIRPLQMIQNAGAWLVFNPPEFSHTTSLASIGFLLLPTSDLKHRCLLAKPKKDQRPLTLEHSLHSTLSLNLSHTQSSSTSQLDPPFQDRKAR